MYSFAKRLEALERQREPDPLEILVVHVTIEPPFEARLWCVGAVDPARVATVRAELTATGFTVTT